jgi:hypothetical protein
MINSLYLYSGLLRGREVENLVGHTGRQASRSATDFDADLGALTMSPRPHAKLKLTLTGTKFRRVAVPILSTDPATIQAIAYLRSHAGQPFPFSWLQHHAGTHFLPLKKRDDPPRVASICAGAAGSGPKHTASSSPGVTSMPLPFPSPSHREPPRSLL